MDQPPADFPEALFHWPTAVCVADPTQDDCPLIFVNDWFCRMTEYRAVEVIGRNCRFLQGDGTDPVEVERLKREIVNAGEGGAVLLNYTKYKRPFLNNIFIQTIQSDSGGKYLLGLQFDVTQTVARRTA